MRLKNTNSMLTLCNRVLRTTPRLSRSSSSTSLSFARTLLRSGFSKSRREWQMSISSSSRRHPPAASPAGSVQLCRSLFLGNGYSVAIAVFENLPPTRLRKLSPPSGLITFAWLLYHETTLATGTRRRNGMEQSIAMKRYPTTLWKI